VTLRMAHKKGVGFSERARDSGPKISRREALRRGVRHRWYDHRAAAGGTNSIPGRSPRASDDSLFPVVGRTVKFEHKNKKRFRGQRVSEAKSPRLVGRR